MKPFLPITIKKLGLLLLSAFGLLTSTTAQTYYHVDEDFESFPAGVNIFPYNNWSNVIIQGDFGIDFWRFNNVGGRTISSPASGKVAAFDSDNYSNNALAEDVSLTTPIINTRGYNNVWVKWDHQFQAGFGGSWAVEVFDGTNWNQVANGTAQLAWRTDSVNVTSFMANKANSRVRFRWRGNYSWWWQVDNLKVYSSVVANNGASLDAVMLAGQCGSANDSVNVTIRNVGSNSLSNIPVKANVNGTIGGNPINSTISTTYTGTLAPGQMATFKVGGFNTLLGGTINYSTYTEVASDPEKTNDTTKVTGYSVFGTPAVPAPSNVTRCGAGTVLLDGAIASGNTGIWYNSASSTSPMWSGATYTTPLMMPPSTQTYYVSQAKTSAYRTLSTGFGGNVWWGAGNPGGNMFSVKALSNLIIDSLSAHINNINSVDISVYYKQGTYVGFETNPSAWTLLNTVTRNGAGAGNPASIKINPLTIRAGETYSFYVRASYEMLFTSGSNSVSNADIELSAGKAISGTFSTVANDFTWNGNIFYRIFCESGKAAVVATANPAPSNSSYNPRTPFAGTVNSGTLANPDVVAPPDVIGYDIVPPTGFANSAYGSTWTFSSVTFRTVNGYTVPTADYVVNNPTSSANGRITFTPSTPFIDSLVKVTFIIKRNDNGCDTVIDRYIYIAPRPDADFTVLNVCDGDFANFANGSTILPSATMSFLWDFGDGTTSTLMNPAKKYATHGTYNVKLYSISNLGYKDSVTKTLQVFEIPKVNFRFVNACEGTSVQMSDNSILPGGTPTYVWDFGDGSPFGAGAATSKLYANPGIYFVKLSVIVNNCKSDMSKYVTQAPRAVPAFSFPTLQCDNANINFTNNTPALPFGTIGYVWNFDDGNVSSSPNPNHSYSAFRTYNVRLIASTDMGCVDSSTQAVTLRESPKPTFTNSAVSCTNSPINFTNSTNVPAGGTNIFKWDFNDGNFSSNEHPTHTFNAEGTYTVVLTVDNTNGCSGVSDKVIVVSERPTADFTSADVCEGEVTQFTNNSYTSNSSTPLTYAWDFGNSKTSAARDTSFVYATPGTYPVSLIASVANGCTDTITKQFKVNPKPVVDIVIASALSKDGTFNFTTNTVGAKYQWLFSDGGNSTSKDTTYRFLTSGVMQIWLKVTSADGCVGLSNRSLVVNPLSIDVTGVAGKLAVYPNPSSGVFVVDYRNLAEGDVTAINITDMLGRVVVASHAPAIGSEQTIDLSSLAAGIYYLNAETPQGPFTIKLSLKK